MQKIYGRTRIPKCDFNKVEKQLFRNHSSKWVFSCKFAAYFQSIFSWEHLWMAASKSLMIYINRLYCLSTDPSFLLYQVNQ